MRKAICVPCKREMAVHRVGVTVEYINLNGTGEKIQADVMRCNFCGTQIIDRFAEEPLARHFDKGYKSIKVDQTVLE